MNDLTFYLPEDNEQLLSEAKNAVARQVHDVSMQLSQVFVNAWNQIPGRSQLPSGVDLVSYIIESNLGRTFDPVSDYRLFLNDVTFDNGFFLQLGVNSTSTVGWRWGQRSLNTNVVSHNSHIGYSQDRQGGISNVYFDYSEWKRFSPDEQALYEIFYTSAKTGRPTKSSNSLAIQDWRFDLTGLDRNENLIVFSGGTDIFAVKSQWALLNPTQYYLTEATYTPKDRRMSEILHGSHLLGEAQYPFLILDIPQAYYLEYQEPFKAIFMEGMTIGDGHTVIDFPDVQLGPLFDIKQIGFYNQAGSLLG